MHTQNEKFQEKMMYLREQMTGLDRLNWEHKRSRIATWNATEKKYRRWLEQIKGNACIIQDGKIKLVNARLLRLTGYSFPEIVDSLFMHFVHPDELPKLSKIYGKRLAGDDVPPIYKTIVKHKDGSSVYVEISSGIINFMGRAATLAILRYLHKRK